MEIKCPHCGNDDKSLIEVNPGSSIFNCVVCSKNFTVKEGKQDVNNPSGNRRGSVH